MVNQLQYKPSRYNYSLKVDDGFIISNLLYNRDVYIKTNSNFNIGEIIELGNENLNGNMLFDYLLENNFIVNSDFNEYYYYEFNNLKKIYDSSKLELTILPTQSCNFRCVYCYQDHEYSKMSDDTIEDIIKYIKKNVRNHNSLYIHWFGGEPLLEKKSIIYLLDNVIDICKKRGIPFLSGITTNGYLLDTNIFSELLDRKVYDYQVTLDGLKESHNKQRPLANGEGTYDTILKNLLNMKNIKKRFNLVIRINISNSMITKLDDYIEFFKNNFSDDSRFKILWHRVHDYGGESIKKNKDLIVKNSEIEKSVNDKSLELGIRNYTDTTEYSNFMCEAVKKYSYIINYDGTLYKCTNAVDKSNNLTDSAIGVLRNGEFEIDDKKEMHWLFQENIEEHCGDCPILPICNHAICPKKIKINKTYECLYEPMLIESIMLSKHKRGEFKDIINLDY